MSVTTHTQNPARTSAPTPLEAVEPAAPPKLRRRPMALIVSVATVVLGALIGMWVWSAAGNSTEVLAVRTLVQRGEVITGDDLMVVRVGLDPAIQTVSAAQANEVAGQRAALDLAPGGLLTPADIAPVVVPGRGTSVVGIGLASGMLPAETLAPGDDVRVVQTPGQQGTIEGTPVTIAATVVGVHPDEMGDQTIVDVLVPSEVAADLAARAATQKVALVLDSRER